MTRRPVLDAQWATVRAARRAAVKPRSTSHNPNLSSPLMVMPRAAEAVETAEHREAALKIADMAADNHKCELDPGHGITECTHPDHDRDVDWARVALDVVGLDDLTDNTDLDIDLESAPERARLTRSAFTRPDWAWQENANCRGEDLTLFFGTDGERSGDRAIREQKAKQVCAGCPVINDCLEEAYREPRQHGVWGGMGPEERTAARKNVMRRRREKGAA